jgi:transposase
MTIPNRTCARIVGMYQGGMKGVKIADKLGVPVMIVQRIVKQFKEDGNFKNHTLNKGDVWNIILFSRSNH